MNSLPAIPLTPVNQSPITCESCQACCCRLEVLLISDTGVPAELIASDRWGGQTMARLDDGWCAALDRSTLRCTIYDRRPLICREFAEGEQDCIEARNGRLPRA
ncbi:YkgJ family cysteine cluster protein [Aestuariirhabdus litorea]|uniref:YkgJ family cysteine cluster protein n=1 Tax=Aestuariirhabdus litorea TaxID=2528527 RepID=A0A3P3VL19_9GAMM|nr:YkgJ family cysteine cluster protein [Aestuariirhabdus litorea]RRJ83017.1 YkgJ family cysteine cluster protein [Aestuariirhabdus litorea]RWW93175.1 YkgJ family cysteine cluster protein [Endozoicomonadaceae bacterium GTF-13]